MAEEYWQNTLNELEKEYREVKQERDIVKMSIDSLKEEALEMKIQVIAAKSIMEASYRRMVRWCLNDDTKIDYER
ncbi:MAG: hypothetical protein FWF57_05135 [Defluviitaleaceae bacterium]|nr:hypothetical protein [Defluviitaleaceae bacterium]